MNNTTWYRKNVTERYKENFAKWMKGLCNEDLFEETLIAAQGDDYDGCFTRIGEWEFEQLKKEFRHRQRAWLLEADAFDAGYGHGYDEGYAAAKKEYNGI